jgi:hypothetical protein
LWWRAAEDLGDGKSAMNSEGDCSPRLEDSAGQSLAPVSDPETGYLIFQSTGKEAAIGIFLDIDKCQDDEDHQTSWMWEWNSKSTLIPSFSASHYTCP